jgi:hypothetical protein
MAGFRFNVFKGIRPRVSKRKLPDGEAQTAENVRLGSGDLEGWRQNKLVTATNDPYQTRTVFLYEDTSADLAYWFQWTDFVDVARGPIKGDSFDRVYYTGDGTPKMTYNTIQSAPPYPSTAYELGVPQPLTRLTTAGQLLPEDVPANIRRTSSDPGTRPQTGQFEIVNVDFTEYPGTGTSNDTWRLAAGALGDISFQLEVGDTLKVLSIVDADTLTLGSATGTGAVAATAQNDKTSVNYWHPMDEQGSTQLADFIGWRIPDGMEVTISNHRLREGDVIRITRLDASYGLSWSWALTSDLFELSPTGGTGTWGVPFLDDDNVTRHENVRLGRSADGATKFELGGGFYYDVDRASSDNDILEDRTYVYTYVSAVGEEGPPSKPSQLVQALDGDAVTLTGFDLAPTGFRNIDRIRIYRTNATAVGTEYQFVKEVTIAQVISDGGAVDTVSAAELGEVIFSSTWFPPPVGMQGIVGMPNGMMVGFEGKNIYFAEPFQPHAYPPEYDQAVDYEVVALAPFANSVAVLTTGTPYLITGSHPRNANIRPYKINQACMYKESVATANDKVYYASPDGLVEIGVNGARITTNRHVWKKEWADFQPELMVGEFHDDKYYGFFGADNTVIPQPTGSVVATGTLVTDAETFEAEIVAGGKTLILTLTNDTWVTAGATFDSVRDDILFSITSNNNEALGWNNQVTNIPTTDVVRTSDTVVTITLSALSAYSITEAEILSIRAPALALTGQSTLVAEDTAILYNDSIYATEVVVTTGWSVSGPDGNVPEVFVSEENIENWARIIAPSGIDPANAVNLRDAAYHKTLGRWAVVGEGSLQADRTYIYSSDDIRDSNSWVERLSDSLPRPRVALYEDITDAIFVGGDGWIRTSNDCINWGLTPLPGSTQGKQLMGLVRSPGAAVGGIPYVYGAFDDDKQVVRSARIDTSPLSTTWTVIDTLTGAGAGVTAICSGDGAVFVCEGTKLGYYAQGGTTYTNIGSLTGSIVDMAYGNGRLVAITDNGSVQYADSPNILTIGNWSAQAAAIDGGVGAGDTCRIEWADGDDTKIGYGFVVTLSGFNGNPGDYQVYTSPDAVTWTLRETVANTQDAFGVGVKYPETDLDGGAASTGVNLSGASIQFFSRILPAPVTRLVVGSDGRMFKQNLGLSPVQISPSTDWIIPNFAADTLYEFRVTNVVPLTGLGAVFAESPGTDGNWFNLAGGDLIWSVQDATFRFDLEVRYNGGPTLSSARYVLASEAYTDPRDFTPGVL